VVAEVVDSALVLGTADRSSVHYWDDKPERLRLLAHRGFSQAWVDAWHDGKETEGIFVDSVRRGTRLVVEDIHRVPRGTLDVHRAEGVRALQLTPLKDRSGKPLGLLSTYYDLPYRADDRQLRLLDLLARQAADILEHGRLLGALGGDGRG
jgi:GAF domain-containing protein